MGANPGHRKSQNSHSPSTNAFRSVVHTGIIGSFSSSDGAHKGEFHIVRLHFCKCIPYFHVALLQVHSVPLRVFIRCGSMAHLEFMTSNSLSSLFRIELDKFNSRNCLLATHLGEVVKATCQQQLRKKCRPISYVYLPVVASAD